MNPIAAAAEFQRRVKLPLELMADTDPNGEELAEVIGKYMDIGDRKEAGEELRLGIRDAKKVPTGEQVQAMMQLQDGQAAMQWKDLDMAAGQA